MVTDEDISEVYDRLAGAYEEEEPAQVIDNWPVGEAVLPDIKGKRVLEAGCGTGYHASHLVERGANVVGVDISKEMIEMATEQYGDMARFLQADLRQPVTELDSGNFDIIVCNHVLVHIEDWRPVMKEFSRLLAEDGQLVMSCDHPFKLYRQNEGEDNQNPPDYYEVERFTKKETLETDEDVTIHFYRRPLVAMLNPLFEAGFVVEALRESIATNDSELFKHFEESIPQFLVIRARKV